MDQVNETQDKPARGPRDTSDAECRRVGIEITDRDRLHVRCTPCGATWSPNIQPGGKMPRGWWKCPKGCNH